MPFQVGDILSKIGIDVGDLKRQLDEAKASVRRFAEEAAKSAQKLNPFAGLTQTLNKVSQSAKVAQNAMQGLGTAAQQAVSAANQAAQGPKGAPGLANISQGLKQIGQQINALQSTQAQTKQTLLNRQANLQLAQSIGANLRIAIGGVAAAFTTAGGAAAKAFKAIAAAPGQVLSRFKSLLQTVTSFKAVLLGFATVRFFQRAGEVDNLTIAFEALSKSIGTLSGRFLTRLRVATRGTISDLDLMRVTNNAILLGVAKTSDEFVRLAEAARRLGQATGLSGVRALEDLSLGIGRQSRLLLDNLGIIVKVEAAYNAFALSIGKTSSTLTQSERVLAFQGAAFKAIDQRIATLGPDVETLGQAVQRLGATLSNVFSDLATTFVRRGAVGALADFIQENRPKLAAFAIFVRDKVNQIVESVIQGFRRLRSGDLSIADILDATFGSVFRVLKKVVVDSVEKLLPVFFTAGKTLGRQIVIGAKTGLKGLTLSLGAELRETFSGARTTALRLADVGQLMVNGINQAFSKLARGKLLPQEQLDSIGDQIATIEVGVRNAIDSGRGITQEALDFLIDLRARLETEVENPAIARGAKQLAADMDVALTAIGKVASEATDKAGEELDKSLGILTGDRKKLREESKKLSSDLGENLRDSLAGFRPLNVDRLLQPIADFIAKLVALRRQLLTTGTDFIPDFLRKTLSRIRGAPVLKIGDLIPDFLVEASAIPIRGLVALTDKISGEINRQRRALEAGKIEEESFLEATKEFEQRVQQLEFDNLTAGATAGARAVAELDRSFSSLSGKPNDDQLRRLKALRDTLQGATSINEATQAVEAFRKQVENLGKTEAQTIDDEIKRSIKSLQGSEAFTFDLGTFRREIGFVREEIEKIKLSDAFKADRNGIQFEISQIERELDAAFSAESVDGLRDALAEIKPSQQLLLDQPALAGVLNDIQTDVQRAFTVRLDIAELEKLRKELDQKAGEGEFKLLTKGVSTSIFQGIVEGFERGESSAKIWASVVSDIFRNSMQKVIDGLTNTLSTAFGKLFAALKLGTGAADIATGLIGIGSTILVGLRNRQDQTVQDFDQAVTSSEAIRGVVAGPTNVAIAKVGDQLKTALRTTEILLAQIAESVSQGKGGGIATNNFSTRLMPSTPS
jgi:hypothetical protein